MLKDAINIIAWPLVNVFNVSLQSAIFPDDWKLAKVSPVFKEGNKDDCGNYRPISAISVVAKIFEKLVYRQLRSFMTLNNILVEQQSGQKPCSFSKGKIATANLVISIIESLSFAFKRQTTNARRKKNTL